MIKVAIETKIYANLTKISNVSTSILQYKSVYIGKNGMVKFFQDWCGHCKRMKPDWDRLAEEESNDNVLIADVNCGDQQDVRMYIYVYVFNYVYIYVYQFEYINCIVHIHIFRRSIYRQRKFLAKNIVSKLIHFLFHFLLVVIYCAK
jgi:thiol-disulfide isomerase/thioredoxin